MKPSASRLENLTRDLTTRIVSGEYSPGERLPTETQLQEKWGVSRSVVREAMKVLASQGLVRIEQGRGTFVSDSDSTPLTTQITLALRRPRAGSTPAMEGVGEWAALLDVRRVLEVAVAERAAQQAGEDDFAAMQSAIEEMRARPAQPAGYVDADLAFHRALAFATGNPLWGALLDALNDLLRRYREASFRGLDSALLAARQHQEILDAVQNHDAAAATEAMRLHLQRSEQDLKKASQANQCQTNKSHTNKARQGK
jgi:GntR family transcriptional repressor for pyruvate dehydrogenase complex